MNKIKIRYNTQDTDGSSPWRIFVDDNQFLASELEIKGFAQGEKSIENGVTKWNIVCFGSLTWINSKAVITSLDKVK